MKTLRALVAELLRVAPTELDDTSSPETIAAWDSFTGLLLVSALEKNFDVRFTSAEVLAVRNYGDIKAALRRHGVTQGVD